MWRKRVKSMLWGMLLVVLVGPALADEYWVQYDYSTHECSIVKKKSEQSGTTASQSGPGANPTSNAAGTPTAGTMPTMLPGSEAPANTIVVAGSAQSPDGQKGAAAPGASSSRAPAAPERSTGNSDEKPNDPYAALAQTWARKKAAAEAAGTADITIRLIGTAQHSREEAQAEMQIMRKCGIAN
jgi:hypothetical protein